MDEHTGVHSREVLARTAADCAGYDRDGEAMPRPAGGVGGAKFYYISNIVHQIYNIDANRLHWIQKNFYEDARFFWR